MLATTTIFYSNDWPKRLFNYVFPGKLAKDEDGKFTINKLSSHCIYEKFNKDDEKADETTKVR